MTILPLKNHHGSPSLMCVSSYHSSHPQCCILGELLMFSAMTWSMCKITRIHQDQQVDHDPSQYVIIYIIFEYRLSDVCVCVTKSVTEVTHLNISAK